MLALRLRLEALHERFEEFRTVDRTADRLDGEVLHALAPKVMDQILHVAYNVFPDSAASKGEKAPADAERASILPAHSVVVRCGDIGGSFGQKAYTSREDVAVAAAAGGRDLLRGIHAAATGGAGGGEPSRA